MDKDSTLPAQIVAQAADGHLRVYRVTGRWSDGTLRTSAWDSTHSDKCKCSTDPESFY